MAAMQPLGQPHAPGPILIDDEDEGAQDSIGTQRSTTGATSSNGQADPRPALAFGGLSPEPLESQGPCGQSRPKAPRTPARFDLCSPTTGGQPLLCPAAQRHGVMRPCLARLQRIFYLDDTVGGVASFLRSHGELESPKFRLSFGRPSRDLLQEDAGLSLEALGIRNDIIRIEID